MAKPNMVAAATQTPLAAIPAGDHGTDEMSEVQAARLRELCEQHGEPFDASLNASQAEQRIEALEAR
ncbi:MAG: DUF3072 domain-containing protein [Paracoccaceae bacterium]